MSVGRGLVVLVTGLVGMGCATRLYPGPRRPDAQVVTVRGWDVEIGKIDGQIVPNGRYELLPGPHVLEVRLDKEVPGVSGTDARQVCIDTARGLYYQVEPVIHEVRWEPRVLEVIQNVVVPSSCGEDKPPASRAVAPVPPAAVPAAELASAAPPAAVPALELAPAAPAEAAPGPPDVAPGEPTTEAPAQPESPGPAPPPPVPPAPQPRQAIDSELPKRPAPVRRGRSAPRPAPELPMEAMQAPRGLLGLRFGVAFGGDTLASATSTSGGSDQSLNAGGGLILALEAMVTPVWLNDTLGIGATGEIGIKYDSLDASNGSVSLMRWPLYLGALALIRANDHIYVRLGGGVEKHVGVHLAVSGDLGSGNADVTSSLGGTGEVGVLGRSRRNFSWDILLRYTAIKYDGATLDGSNVSISTALGYVF